ncbi:hypothetical protein AMATHDRAFT_45345 [Amanita thiersii Skay4041]|uniref:Uncharacterized protein n=1 Tax=Amanita thiersii Skay4041 TaxID=703135 RepID=A0A2A9NSE7_9AGAR|nr:hypothetical protein AMATHDRAFT_45345 [Amanita thiersii Skay4041]
MSAIVSGPATRPLPSSTVSHLQLPLDHGIPSGNSSLPTRRPRRSSPLAGPVLSNTGGEEPPPSSFHSRQSHSHLDTRARRPATSDGIISSRTTTDCSSDSRAQSVFPKISITRSKSAQKEEEVGNVPGHTGIIVKCENRPEETRHVKISPPISVNRTRPRSAQSACSFPSSPSGSSSRHRRSLHFQSPEVSAFLTPPTPIVPSLSASSSTSRGSISGSALSATGSLGSSQRILATETNNENRASLPYELHSRSSFQHSITSQPSSSSISRSRPSSAQQRSVPGPTLTPRPSTASSATSNSSSTSSSQDPSWLTQNTYGITPRFSRLGLASPGVVMPLSVKQYQRRQEVEERSKKRQSIEVAAADQNMFPSPQGHNVRVTGTKRQINMGSSLSCVNIQRRFSSYYPSTTLDVYPEDSTQAAAPNSLPKGRRKIERAKRPLSAYSDAEEIMKIKKELDGIIQVLKWDEQPRADKVEEIRIGMESGKDQPNEKSEERQVGSKGEEKQVDTGVERTGTGDGVIEGIVNSDREEAEVVMSSVPLSAPESTPPAIADSHKHMPSTVSPAPETTKVEKNKKQSKTGGNKLWKKTTIKAILAKLSTIWGKASI